MHDGMMGNRNAKGNAKGTAVSKSMHSAKDIKMSKVQLFDAVSAGLDNMAGKLDMRGRPEYWIVHNAIMRAITYAGERQERGHLFNGQERRILLGALRGELQHTARNGLDEDHKRVLRLIERLED